MIFVYRFLINLVFIFSPLIILIRMIKGKEDINRFLEKFCFFSKKRVPGDLIWFHGASVGELQSIIPLLEKISKRKKLKQILITSNTLSSAKVIEKLKLKKVIHQYFPLDCNFLDKKFLDYWKPSKVFFIDSEIWPNMILNLSKRKIKTILLNGRLTKKSFHRWKYFSNFAKNIFEKFDLCLSSSKEGISFLKKLGACNVKFLGNLKFTQSENDKFSLDNKLSKFFNSKKIWCASSTHPSEEKFCALIHLKLKKKHKNLTTIIIPRHIERTNKIVRELNDLKLKLHLHKSGNKIDPYTDIYLVNTYGETKKFYNISNNVFLGGSLVEHGGQNPLEAVRFGCKIFHGPNTENFKEIYNFLDSAKIATKILNEKKILSNLDKSISKGKKSNYFKRKINIIGNKILDKSIKEINSI